MLCLNRKLGQGIQINDDVTITIIEIRKQTVRLGITYSEKSRVLRSEVYLKIESENKEAALSIPKIEEAFGKVITKKILPR
ncbi:MAG: carbon storage regulator [Alphaproteobacteria bacterium]|nr:carbon storage regulator [Alphaproteobacteria bacterium]